MAEGSVKPNGPDMNNNNNNNNNHWLMNDC